MDEAPKNNLFSIWKPLRLFLLAFVPLILIVAVISLAYYFSTENVNIQDLQEKEKFRVELQVDAFSYEFQSVVSDLVALSAHHQFRLISDGDEAADYSALASEFLIFCRNKKMYDQVRFLDETGMEIVRVNFNFAQPVIVPTDQLQSKGGRYYFKDTFNLNKGEVFVSPFDLNIEGGVIERPLKPMIRFGMPIFDSSGAKRGIVILNYFGNKLINQMQDIAHASFNISFQMLLNSDGYFLKGMREEDEWGFMLPGREKKTFSRLFPAQWDKVRRDSSGQFLDDQGLFTFTTVFPLTEGLKSSSGSPEAFASRVQRMEADKYQWKIVLFTPYEEIQAMTSQVREVLIISNAWFGLFAGIGLWFLVRAIVRRQSAEAKIEHMAHFDLLTGLPNRPTLYDRMDIALAAMKRENKHLCVMFLDLDGFKGVNDSHGHEAGDQVLIEVAQRLQQSVRGMDTVARLGGDEFVLVLTSITDMAAVESFATKVINLISEPIMFKGQACNIGASIGIAMYPKDGITQDVLLSKADAAMYAAKESGKNTYRLSA